MWTIGSYITIKIPITFLASWDSNWNTGLTSSTCIHAYAVCKHSHVVWKWHAENCSLVRTTMAIDKSGLDSSSTSLTWRHRVEKTGKACLPFFFFLNSKKLHSCKHILWARWAIKTSIIPDSYKKYMSWLELMICCANLKPFVISSFSFHETELVRN